jgi:hypothetical protein
MKKFLAVVLLALSVSTLRAEDPYKLTDQGDYEKSDVLLKQIQPNSDEFAKYAFYRGVNAFAMNNKDEAKKWLELVFDSFDKNIPTRYKNTAGMMLYDLENWKKDDLGDIGRDMGISGNKLKNNYAGEKTQHVQKEIVNKLDKMIKELENKGKGGDGQANGKDSLPGPGGQGQPAQDSHVMGGSGAGKVDEKKLRQVAENWGTLPPARRAEIIQEITRDLPPKYKPMIDEYFKALNRTHK